MARHHVIACHVLWREICYHASLSHNVFVFTFLPQGLHNTPEKLRDQVQAAKRVAQGEPGPAAHGRHGEFG